MITGLLLLCTFRPCPAVQETTRPQIRLQRVASTLWTYVQDVEVEGTYAYCVLRNGLIVLDVSDPTHPVEAGEYELPHGGRVLRKVGHLLYVTDDDDGFWVLDSADPESLRIVGEFHAPARILDMDVGGRYAYLGATDLLVVDISHPQEPELVGTCAIPGGVKSVSAHRDRVYVSVGQVMRTVDVSDPSAPKIMGTYTAAHSGADVYMRRVGSERPSRIGSHAEADVFAGGPYVYFSDGESGIQILDASDPVRPQRHWASNRLGAVKEVQVVGTYAYLSGDAGLQILDISDPASPEVVGALDTPGEGLGLLVREDRVYFADGFYGFDIIDVSDPTGPSLLGRYETPYQIYGVCTDGDRAYVACSKSGLAIVDVSDPAAPSTVAMYRTTDDAYDVRVREGRAYVAALAGDLRVVDVSDPEHPALVDSCSIPGRALGLFLDDRYLYVAGSGAGFGIVDISGAHPRLLGWCRTPGDAYGIFVDRDVAYVASFMRGLQIADVSDPENPMLLSSFPTGHLARRVWADGGYVYVADAKGGLQIVDVTDPSTPAAVSIHRTPDWALGLWGAHGYVYVTAHWAGVRVLDVSDPRHLAEVTAYDTPGSGHTVYLDGDLLYVADKYSLVILRKMAVPEAPQKGGLY